jgi:hypothetical protein
MFLQDDRHLNGGKEKAKTEQALLRSARPDR